MPGLTTSGSCVSPVPLPSLLAQVSGKRDFQKQSRPGCSGLCALPACRSCPRAPQPQPRGDSCSTSWSRGARLLHPPRGPSSSGLNVREALGSCTGSVVPTGRRRGDGGPGAEAAREPWLPSPLTTAWNAPWDVGCYGDGGWAGWKGTGKCSNRKEILICTNEDQNTTRAWA